MKTYDFSKSPGIVVSLICVSCLFGGCGGDADISATNGATNNAFGTPGAKAPAPIVSSFTPEAGAPGSSVTITGENFRTATSVTFNGASAGFSILSATQIRATVPKAATTGKITVFSGEAFGSSINDFTVQPPTETKK